MAYLGKYDSSLGLITLASDGENLTGLWLEGQKYFAQTLEKGALQKDDLPVFSATKNWLDEYFKGKNPPIANLPLAPKGGEFRQEVWGILCEIPYGKLLTYGDIAKMIASKRGKETMSSQAVGGAVGRNPISIIIPCHRVVGSNGNLTGYAGGIDKKIKLLELEGADTTKLFRRPNL